MLVLHETSQRRSIKNKLKALFGAPSYLSEKSAAMEKATGHDVYNLIIAPKNQWLSIMVFSTLIPLVTIYRNYENMFSFEIQLIVLLAISGCLFYIGMLLDKLPQKRVRQCFKCWCDLFSIAIHFLILGTAAP